MSDTKLTTIPAMTDDNQLADELEPGVDVLHDGSRHTVSEITRRGIKFEDGGGARIAMLNYDGMEIIVGEEDGEDEQNVPDDESSELELVIAGATERDESESYCRVTVDGKLVAVTDLTQTEGSLDLYEDDELVMQLEITEGSGRAANAIWDAIANRTGARVTVTGTLLDWHDEQVSISDPDE